MSKKFKINELSRESGVHLETIRYYEKLGLLTPPPRQANGYRLFDERHLSELHFIKACRAIGLSLDECKAMLALQQSPNAPCQMANELAQKHLKSVEVQLNQLQQIRTLLERMIGCEGQTVAHCQVLQHIKALG